MIITVHKDVQEFLAVTRDYLLKEEATNSLLFGVADYVASGVENPESYFWFSVSDQGSLKLAGFKNDINLVLSHGDQNTIHLLAKTIFENKINPPGVIGPAPLADLFRDEYAQLRGCTYQLRMDQGLYQLTKVLQPRTTEGNARAATTADLKLTLEWYHAFVQEALPEEKRDEERALSEVKKRTEMNNLYLWEVDGVAVSMAALGRPTPNGISVSLVYTPKELREKGYASAITAVTSEEGLKRGKKFCVLYTDLMNPTSNSIYKKIGYECIIRSRNWAFRT